jgi:choline dehydrogenase-like flavoprotein
MSILKENYDVVIIGAGAGGGAIAWALTTKKIKVLLLDAGPKYTPEADFKLNTQNWEDGFPYKYKSPPVQFVSNQPLDSEYGNLRSWNHIQGLLNSSNKRKSFGYHRVQGIGGSSLHYSAEAHRMNPESMQMKSRFGVAGDWPVTYKELEPYYVQAEKILGVAGDSEYPPLSRWRSAKFPHRKHEFSAHSQILNNGFKNLGLNLEHNSLAVLSSPSDGRPSCNYCGCCLKGCSRKDKGTIDLTYIKKAMSTGFCTILPNAAVKRVETGTKDKVEGIWLQHDEKITYLKCSMLVVAGGAIETPRLLLASDSSQSPDGLCNESGLVGKNFMETLLWTSSCFYPQKVNSHKGIPVDAICWDFNNPDSIPGVVGGCRFSPSVAESDLLGPRAYATRVVDGWGLSHKRKMREVFGSILSVSGICESLPHDKSYVGLSADKDESGMPLPVISSYLDESAIKRIGFMSDKCREILAAAGGGKIFEEFSSYDVFSSTHVFGTCRMGKDKERSVVSDFCKSHRWKNLYIVDASVFPSSGGGESPSLTIQALALRVADNIVNDSRRK